MVLIHTSRLNKQWGCLRSPRSVLGRHGVGVHEHQDGHDGVVETGGKDDGAQNPRYDARPLVLARVEVVKERAETPAK